MVKNSMIISVSIDKEMAEFLDSTNLSPSDLIQEKILEQKRIFDSYNQEKEKLLKNLQSIQQEVGNLHQFIEELGKFEDFRKWRGQHVLEE